MWWVFILFRCLCCFSYLMIVGIVLIIYIVVFVVGEDFRVIFFWIVDGEWLGKFYGFYFFISVFVFEFLWVE